MKKCNHHLKKKMMKKIFLMLCLAVFAFSCDNAAENKGDENKENVNSTTNKCTKECCSGKNKATSSLESTCKKVCCANKSNEKESCGLLCLSCF